MLDQTKWKENLGYNNEWQGPPPNPVIYYNIKEYN